MKPGLAFNCYCSTTELESSMITCSKCRRSFHPDCLLTGKPSSLEGDVFFHLVCSKCSPLGEEEVVRMKLQWLQVVMLALYNLQLSETGKNGFYRWKEQICGFIDRHWHTFFGNARKKTHTWFGTVAGTLSQGCPAFFVSGTNVLKESGWWKLATNKPPGLETLQQGKPSKRFRLENSATPVKVEGLRSRRNKTSIQAAIELREKRDTLHEAKDIRKAKGLTPVKTPPSSSSAASGNPSTSTMQAPHALPLSRSSLDGFIKSGDDTDLHSPDTSLSEAPGSASRLGSRSFELTSDMTDQSSQMSFSSTRSELWLTDRDLVAGAELPQCLLENDDDEGESEFEIDPCALSPASTPLHGSSTADSILPVEDMISQLRGESSQREDNSSQELSFGSLLSKIKSDHNFEMHCSAPSIEEQTVFIKQEDDNSLLSNSINMEVADTSSVMDSVKEEVTDLVLNKQCAEFEWGDGGTKDSGINQGKSTCLPQSIEIKQEIVEKDCESGAESSSSSSSADQSDESVASDDESRTNQPLSESAVSPPRKRRRRRQATAYSVQKVDDDDDEDKSNLVAMSQYEEKQTLRTLKTLGAVADTDPAACRLRRKLLVRQLKKTHGVPAFDLDAIMNNLVGSRRELYGLRGTKQEYQKLNPDRGVPSQHPAGSLNILDRFQRSLFHSAVEQRTVSFLNRLVGVEDDQLQPGRSPYTARMLKPFIRRDYESRPLKLRLLLQIQAHAHRNDPTWKPEPPAPIDYCYVRPQHIPSVNNLCQQFFWPGIDLSETLQYPDFTCVVLYRKFVIGFAFMVPDVKYNEAYISFIFTHPEWRRAGIAKFMIYHLIQTCMGKDVTLHVSASNHAMLLYQKFGFKPEELILDFYDKYFPIESTECRHAFFLRLRR